MFGRLFTQPASSDNRVPISQHLAYWSAFKPYFTFRIVSFRCEALEHARSPEDLVSNILPLNKDFAIAENFAVLAAHFRGGWTANAYELFEVSVIAHARWVSRSVRNIR